MLKLINVQLKYLIETCSYLGNIKIYYKVKTSLHFPIDQIIKNNIRVVRVVSLVNTGKGKKIHETVQKDAQMIKRALS